MPPRATPADYQAHAQAGEVTIAAEFTGHSVTTPEQVLSTENFIIMEVGLFGAPGARLKLSHDDFSVRVNGKKTTSPGQPFGAIFKSLKDPEYVPPEPAASKSKGGISSGGGGRNNQSDLNSPPPVIHIPIEVERAMEQRVQKASLAEGDRPLPQAGLIYFEYGGKVSGIHSLELIYNGAGGKAVLTLQP